MQIHYCESVLDTNASASESRMSDPSIVSFDHTLEQT